MTSLSKVLSDSNSGILRRNLSLLSVRMKDSEDLSKYEALLDKEDYDPKWDLKSIPPPSIEPDDIHAPLNPAVTQEAPENHNKEDELDEIPPTPVLKGSSPSKRTLRLQDRATRKAKRQAKEHPERLSSPSSLSLRSTKKTSSKNTSNDVFNADAVVDKELEALVPNTQKGTKNKKALSKYFSDGAKKGTLGMTRRARRSMNKSLEGEASQSITQFFTPVRQSVSKKSIDELLSTPPEDAESVSPSTWTSLDEMTKELKKCCRLSKKRSFQREESRKHRKDYQESSTKMKEELIQRLSADDMKNWVSNHEEFINKVWAGEAESSRYEAFHKSTESRHGLLYSMITHPFSDSQVEAVLEVLTKIWMPSSELLNKHIDFVWKVVLAEILIKIYMETFDLEDKAEAEKRIASTPFDSDDDNNYW